MIFVELFKGFWAYYIRKRLALVKNVSYEMLTKPNEKNQPKKEV